MRLEFLSGAGGGAPATVIGGALEIDPEASPWASAATMPTHEEKIRAAKRKAEEMKRAAAERRAAREAAGAGPAATPAQDELFALGEENLTLIDWDDTMFPTSAWKNRVKEDASHPPSAGKVQALSQAVSELIRTLQRFGAVKIVTHGTKGWFEMSSRVLLPETKALLDSLDHRYRDSYGGKYEKKQPAGQKYATEIGVLVDSRGQWFKTDMFFHFVTERKTKRAWDQRESNSQSPVPARPACRRLTLRIAAGGTRSTCPRR
jgi:hypothetical protein